MKSYNDVDWANNTIVSKPMKNINKNLTDSCITGMKQNGPYRIEKSQIKYKNPWIEVCEDKVIHPNGKPGIFGTVKMLDGVSVLALDNDGFVYLTDEFHYAVGKNSIEAVSGAIDKGEKPLETAKRELKEEAGITAKDWIYLGVVNPFTTLIKSHCHLFLAKNLSFGDAKPEETENIKIIKLKFKKTVEMVMKSQITHTGSCVLILKAKEYLEKNEE